LNTSVDVFSEAWVPLHPLLYRSRLFKLFHVGLFIVGTPQSKAWCGHRNTGGL
jgi:hypothetical protein